jgi:hypothetical protein
VLSDEVFPEPLTITVGERQSSKTHAPAASDEAGQASPRPPGTPVAGEAADEVEKGLARRGPRRGPE